MIRSLDDLSPLAGNGCTWSIRDVAAHIVVCANFYSEIANGVPSPVVDTPMDELGALAASLMSNIPETDPVKMAALLEDSMASYLGLVGGRPGDQMVTWHWGLKLDLATMTGLLLSEVLLHGYDVACGLGVPWPIDPAQALLCVGACAPILPALVNGGAAAGHTAAYGVSLRGGDAMTIRFTDGALSIEPPGGPVDCEISVDPVAFQLVFTRRLSQSAAIALGLISAGGTRPELAGGFLGLFDWPQ
jgi:hypothetical protein